MFGNHITDAEKQADNITFVKLIAMNCLNFDMTIDCNPGAGARSHLDTVGPPPQQTKPGKPTKTTKRNYAEAREHAAKPCSGRP